MRPGRSPLPAFWRAALAALLASRPVEALAQCAMCSTAAAGNKVARGLAFSIFFMLASLSLMVLGLVFVVVRRSRRRDGERGPRPEE